MFSTRTPRDLTPNRLTDALNAAGAEGRAILDLTLSNPTRAGFEYPSRLPDDVQARLSQAAIDAMRAVGFDHGAFNVELFWRPSDGAIRVIEGRHHAQRSNLIRAGG